MLNWFKPKPCQACAAKDDAIERQRALIRELSDIRAVMGKLEELAKLEARKDTEITAIEHLRLKHRAEEKAKRERPPTWMAGREEGRLPPL